MRMCVLCVRKDGDTFITVRVLTLGAWKILILLGIRKITDKNK